jgi:hypothetical protein
MKSPVLKFAGHFVITTSQPRQPPLEPQTTERESAKMDIRLLHPSDIPHVQHANITNLPEKYIHLCAE